MNINEMEYVGDCGIYGHGYCRALAECKVTDRPRICLTKNDGQRCEYLATCPQKPIGLERKLIIGLSEANSELKKRNLKPPVSEEQRKD